MPSHNHIGNGASFRWGEPATGVFGYENNLWRYFGGGYNAEGGAFGYSSSSNTYKVKDEGGGQPHTHSGSVDMAVQYVDVIICTRN